MIAHYAVNMAAYVHVRRRLVKTKTPIAIGLKDATPDEIAALVVKYPSGCHITHKLTGEKLPYNGVFYCQGKFSKTLSSWAIL